jgi:hypothetical protein
MASEKAEAAGVEPFAQCAQGESFGRCGGVKIQRSEIIIRVISKSKKEIAYD